MITIKRYDFDWYGSFGVKVINSKRAYYGYGGVRYNNPEYGFFDSYLNLKSPMEPEHAIDVLIPRFLVQLEKIHLLTNGNLPSAYDPILFDGNPNEVDIAEIYSGLPERFLSEAGLNAMITLKVENADKRDQAVFFQKRISWELGLDISEEPRRFFVYGRFNTGTI